MKTQTLDLGVPIQNTARCYLLPFGSTKYWDLIAGFKEAVEIAKKLDVKLPLHVSHHTKLGSDFLNPLTPVAFLVL